MLGRAFRRPFAAVFAFAGAALVFADRPHAPEPPMSASSLAYGRGGSSALEGVGGLLHNPATLRWRGGTQVELGMLSLAAGLSPYAVMGYQIPGGSAGALGGFRAETEDDAYQGVLGGFTWPLGEEASVGLGISGVFAKGDFGADAHAGLWSQFGDHGEVGLFVRNVMASGIGEVPEGMSTEREIGFGFGTAYEHIRLWRIHLRDLGLRYDFASMDWLPSAWKHSVSGQIWLPPAGSWGLLTGLSVGGEDPAPKPSFGFGARLPFGGGSLRVIYAMSPTLGSAAEAAQGQSHSLALHYEAGRQQDVLAPELQIQALPSRLSADSVGKIGLYFRLQADDPDGETADWELLILRTDVSGRIGEAVMRYHGKELPPRLIRWSGEDAGGQAVAPGLYAYRFEASDKAGHETTAPIGVVELF